MKHLNKPHISAKQYVEEYDNDTLNCEMVYHFDLKKIKATGANGYWRYRNVLHFCSFDLLIEINFI